MFEDVPERTRRTMRAIRSTETKPERMLRSLLHRAGYRFTKNVKGLPGSPDVAFSGRKKAIFVHGCFWHQHPKCKHAGLPKQRQEYWLPKLARTQERDRAARAELTRQGWSSLVIWECEIGDKEALSCKLRSFLGAPRAEPRQS